MKRSLKYLAFAAAVVFLAACNDGGDERGSSSSTGGGGSAPFPAFPSTLAVSFGLKEVQFSWAAVPGADFYRLFENPDGVSGFSQISGDLTALSYNHPIAVHRRPNASYALEACNSTGCKPVSGPMSLTGLLTLSVGFVKSFNPGKGHEFGNALALSADGNTLAVGARGEYTSTGGVNPPPDELGVGLGGAVYVFIRGPSGWTQQAFIKGSNAGVDVFGAALSVSADGNTLAVGAPNEGDLDSGAAYVFIRNGTEWSQQAHLKGTDAGNLFGWSVALSGDGNTLVVGAPDEDGSSANPAEDEGAAYVFIRSGSAWSQQAFLKASIPNTRDGFGTAVALSTDGNTLAVGAWMEGFSGAAYVFRRTGSTWSEQAYLKASNAGVEDVFGNNLTLSGDGNTLAVGAYLEDSSSTGVNSTPNDGASNAGAVYVFRQTSGVWSEQAYLKAANAAANAQFGWAVALSADGNTLAVGAVAESSGTAGVNSAPDITAPAAGAAYVFTRSGSVWSQQAYVKASNTGTNDRFGSSVALSGDGSTLAVGAIWEDSSSTGVNSTPNEGAINAGAVYLY